MSAAAGIPPAAVELAVIEVDRRRMTKVRAPHVANRPLRKARCPATLDSVHNVLR
jgi:hypothetical protein